MKKKTFVILAGESAVGKSTLMRALQKNDSRFVPVPLTTDRFPRTLEQEDRNCIGKDEFDKKTRDNEFIHVIEKYGNRYGILRSAVTNALAQNKIPVSDYVVQEIAGLDEFKESLCVFYVLPPSLLVLKKRLKRLGRDPDGTRFQLAKSEIDFVKSRDFNFPHMEGVVVNKDLKKTTRTILEKIYARQQL